MSKPIGKFINIDEYWELDYCLKKYGYSASEENRKRLKSLIINKIKPYFNLTSSENLEWDQIDQYYKKFKF